MVVKLVFKNCNDDFFILRKEVGASSLFDYLSDVDGEYSLDVRNFLSEFALDDCYVAEVRVLL